MAIPRWRSALAGVGLTGVLVVATAAPAVAEPDPAPVGGSGAVFVELDRPSALQEYLARVDQGVDRARRAARDAKDAIDQLTDELLAAFPGTEDAAEIFRTSNAVPGVALRADAVPMRELAARPGVRSVRRLPVARTSNASADQLGRAMQSWQQTGRLGTGVRIGIVDTGVDYTHADFGGPGTRAAYEEIDPIRVDPGTFPTEKVVGGIDLAGDDYDADSADPAHTVPSPDGNPLDCGGHGTHVAGTAAGYGVTADGDTFRGDHTALTPAALDDMRIGPGSAPDASLYAIRVFGCSGSTSLTALGLDHALDPNGDGDFEDRLDVVNLSLGSAFGAVDDPVNDFVRVLTENGVLVVAAAGNSGDVYDSGGSPGNSPEALSVASVRDAGVLFDGIEVQAPAALAGPLPGQYSIGYEGYDTLDRTAPVVELGGSNAEGCARYAPADAARVRGAYVWLAWSDDDAGRACGSASRAQHAAEAGAAGVLLTSEQGEFGSTRIAGNADIPVFQLTGPATAALRPELGTGALRVRFAGALTESQQVRVPEIEDTPSEFSARGVRGPTVKPDVAAPGESITSAESGSGNAREKQSGTSMASPFVAGVAALVLQEHPRWSPARVKAAIMGTATADVFEGEDHTGPVLTPMRVGAGRVDARAALATSLLATNAERPAAVSVTFGTVEVPAGEALVRRQRVRVTNTGALPAALTAEYQAATEIPGVRIEVSPARLVVAPGLDTLLDVTLRIDDPAALRRTADPTLELVQDGRSRQYPADASGRIVLTSQDGRHGPLRVPVSAAPKPVSDLAAELVGDTLALSGDGVDQGSGREAYRSRAGVFALAASSPQLPLCATHKAVAGCVVNGTGSGGDLRHVGVTSTVGAARAAGRAEDALLGIAVTTWADLYNVGSLTKPIVEYDVDGNGRPDFGTELVTLAGTDALVARTLDLRALPDPVEVDVQPVNGFDGATDTNVFDTDAWVLPVRLAALGIDPAAPSAPLRLRVSMLGEYGSPGGAEGLVDAIDEDIEFDPFDPAVAVRPTGDEPDPALLLHPADDGTRLALDRAAGTPLLALLGQNGSGERSAVLGAGAADAADARAAAEAAAAAEESGGAVEPPGAPVDPPAPPAPVSRGLNAREPAAPSSPDAPAARTAAPSTPDVRAPTAGPVPPRDPVANPAAPPAAAPPPAPAQPAPTRPAPTAAVPAQPAPTAAAPPAAAPTAAAPAPAPARGQGPGGEPSAPGP